MRYLEEPATPVATRVRWAGLAGRRHGVDDATGPSFVFLHGLTFDRLMWNPVLAALPDDHTAIAFDLPGHGGTPMLARRGLAPVVEALHESVLDAGLDAPIVVGHSIGGPLAALYAASHPAAGVVSVEAPIRLEPFAHALRSLVPELTGPGFDRAWERFRQSWHMERVPAPQRELLRVGEHASQPVVLSYQADLLERPFDEVARWREEGLSRLASTGTPYVSLHGDPVEPADRAFLGQLLPQSEIVVWPVGHHFPHLADPVRFARLLTALAADVPGR